MTPTRGTSTSEGGQSRLDQQAPLLSVEELCLSFGPVKAVDGLSFSIQAGETLALVGESGSGKSLTSLALLGLQPREAQVSGRILFVGRSLLEQDESSMRQLRGQEIAMIFQEPMTALNPVMRVGAQVAEAVRAHAPSISRKALRKRVLDALSEVALPDAERRMEDYPHQFSGGQRQRIVIAMALVNRPRLLIADEPTTALDVTVQAQILELLQSIQRSHGLAMLFISHDLAVVRQIAQRVVVLQHGRVVEAAFAEAIFHAPQAAYTQQLLASVPTMATDRTRPLANVRKP